jgi:oxalate decarboxylase
MTHPSRFVRSLTDAIPAFESDLGSVTAVTAHELPALDGLSIKRLVLEPGTMREPQWNVDANQLAYCLSGRVLVSVLGNGDSFSSFVVAAGQMYHVESGAVYHVQNIGDERAELILALRSHDPQHFSLRDSVNAMTPAVLGNTYNLPSSAFAEMPREDASQIVRIDSAPAPQTALLPDARFFDVEGQHAPLTAEGGSAHLARVQFWPALQDLSMYSLRIKGDGMREPHWHPVTAEMGYVHRGHGRMRILGPDGVLDELLLQPGDVYFVPRAYPHHIEALEDDGIHFAIFFDQSTPGDVGYRATASAFPKEVVASAFSVRPDALPDLPYTPVDPLIVSRVNPRD